MHTMPYYFHFTLQSVQTEEKLFDKWLSVIEEQISMLPSLANQKMWDQVGAAIFAGWSVNSVLKVKRSVWRVSCVLTAAL